MRHLLISGLLGLLAFSVACTNKKVSNPLANVGSKQPDKVLFDRSMDAMKHNRFDVARITLHTPEAKPSMKKTIRKAGFVPNQTSSQ